MEQEFEGESFITNWIARFPKYHQGNLRELGVSVHGDGFLLHASHPAVQVVLERIPTGIWYYMDFATFAHVVRGLERIAPERYDRNGFPCFMDPEPKGMVEDDQVCILE